MNTVVEPLSNIIEKITNKEILLPDFQRNFVWRDEEKQSRLIASVLAKMPVGSILLLIVIRLIMPIKWWDVNKEKLAVN